MLKRAFTLILPVSLALSFGFTAVGCDKKEEKKDEKKTDKKADEKADEKAEAKDEKADGGW